jgi:signal transduction histidine kinase
VRVSDRLRRQMLADVSHELKTPLTSMRGYLETLHMPEVAVEPATRDRYIDTIRQETLRLERIVQDLLDLARFENDAGSLNPRLFALERLFQRVCQRYERIAAARRVTLAWDVAPAADQIVGDPDRLEQAIDNLVANALRHSPEGGWVTVSATTDDAGAAISVVDQGRGIPPEHLPYVFDRFYRADAGRSAASGGSGLGLSIVKAIVERHGGNVEVSSVPGRTAFTVRLPQQLDIDVHELIADAPGGED